LLSSTSTAHASSAADKGHTCERSRNHNGALSGADASTAADAAHWSPVDVERRMDFALRCAYAHGTQAVRTHLMSGSRAQFELAWCAALLALGLHAQTSRSVAGLRFWSFESGGVAASRCKALPWSS
jgi:hypothetical protein